MPYMKNPELDPMLRIYFSKEWDEASHPSVRNFFSEVFNGIRIPALLTISSEKNTVNRLKKDIKHLNVRLSQLQTLLEEKETNLSQLRRDAEATSRTTQLHESEQGQIGDVAEPAIKSYSEVTEFNAGDRSSSSSNLHVGESFDPRHVSEDGLHSGGSML